MTPSSSPPNFEFVNAIEGKVLIYYLLEVSVYSVLLSKREKSQIFNSSHSFLNGLVTPGHFLYIEI